MALPTTVFSSFESVNIARKQKQPPITVIIRNTDDRCSVAAIHNFRSENKDIDRAIFETCCWWLLVLFFPLGIGLFLSPFSSSFQEGSKSLAFFPPRRPVERYRHNKPTEKRKEESSCCCLLLVVDGGRNGGRNSP